MAGLDKLIRDYYQGQSLAPERVEAILQRAAAQGRPASRRRTIPWSTLAASLVVCAVAVLLHLQIMQRNVTELVLAEVAMNHREALAPEVRSARYPVIRQHLERLDFPLSPPTAGMLPTGAKLLGGRYCSIHGELAAQLSFENPDDGRRYTLFITPLTERLREIGDGHGHDGGVDISLWHEEQLFYALAVDD